MSLLDGHPARAMILAASLGLTACAGLHVDDDLSAVQRGVQQRLGADLQWLRSDEARRQAQADVDAALAKPLSADDAVRIALSYSPALQATLFDGAAASAAATQWARAPNPVFAFERLLRSEGRDLEITRSLSVSLLELLTLPQRGRMAGQRQQQVRLQLAAEVLQGADAARRAWVQAVAAAQSLRQVAQIKQAADASAELARRMRAAGNFSALQSAREQAFAADAGALLARAQQAALAQREALVRALGLNDTQAAALTLPDALPDLPDLPDPPANEAPPGEAELAQRLDVGLVRARLDALAEEQGLARFGGVLGGTQLGLVQKGEAGLDTKRGLALELPLPVFDSGDALRTQAQANTLAAVNRLAALLRNASSQLRERRAAQRSAYALARRYRDEIVPLHQAIADENLLRYNGMQIGLFELLADAREQAGSVLQGIDAQRDFWLADAALQAARSGSEAPKDQP